MEDSELTRKAIAELMEMGEQKDKENLATERKKNPLGKPNKLFLGRTINSIMKHNKRQSDRNLQRCERKIKELDSKKLKYEHKNRRKNYDMLKCSQESISSDSSNEGFVSKPRKTKKKVKKKCRSRTSSPPYANCSSVTDSSSSLNSSATSRKKRRHSIITKEEYDQDFYNDFTNDQTMGYCVDPYMAYAVMASNQMNHIMQQQLHQQSIVEKELEENVESPSDLSISFHTSPESSLNISLHSSSAEEDENGVITFKLSSDDEENISSISQGIKKNSTDRDIFVSIDCDDIESIHSHISLDSKKSILKETNEIYVLSSSDSDELEIVEICNSPNSTK